MREVSGSVFITDKKINPSVIIKICPGGCLRGMERQYAGRHRYIFKGAIPIIFQQRIGLFAKLRNPGSPQYQDICKAVIIVMRLNDVQSTLDSVYARSDRAIRE